MMLIKNENKYDHFFETYGRMYDLDPLLLKAQVKQESRFNPHAISGMDAKGLAQFMDRTWDDWGEGSIFDPGESIKAQAKYMRWLKRIITQRTSVSDDITKWTLAAYNWGIGNVIKQLDKKYYFDIADLPGETKIYVEKVLAYYEEYKSVKEAEYDYE